MSRYRRARSRARERARAKSASPTLRRIKLMETAAGLPPGNMEVIPLGDSLHRHQGDDVPGKIATRRA